jgi:signal transduction histidine kinase
MNRRGRAPWWSFGAVLAAAALLIAGALFSFHSTSRALLAARETVDDRMTLRALYTGVLEAESAQRGFLLTGKDEYLGPYESGRAQVEKDLSTIERFASVPLGAELRAVVDRKLEELAGSVELARSGERDRALALMRADVGRNLMDTIRDETAIIDHQLGEQVRARRAAARMRDRLSSWVIGASAVAIGVTLALAWAVRRELDWREGQARQLEHHVAERTSRLREANHELEAFSYSVSHDLRAPLRAISGYCQILEEEHATGLDPEARGLLERVRAAARRMSQLIDDLLELSRVSRAELQRERIDVSVLAAEIVEQLRRTSPERSVDVTIQPGLRAVGDENLLRIALTNLLENAWKFTAREAHAHIELTSEDHDGQRAFVVSDDGAGFDPKYADRLFVPFHRLHGASEFEGTGIGLATVKRIVAKHGGDVWVEHAARGGGAAFAFTLPAEAA